MEYGYELIVVDDDELEHQVLIRLLRNTPHRIKCFEHPDEALSFLTSYQPRNLFVDYRMHSTDGLTFIRKLASVIDLDNINVFLTSSVQITEDVQVKARELGVQFLLKDVFTTKGYLENMFAEKVCVEK